MDPLSTHFNNPGAIIPGDKITYEGMLGTDPKSGLAIFDTPENGRKALEKDLAIKFGRGVNTPQKFARAYLGPKADQQEVDNYAMAVADSYGFDATDKEFSQDTLPHLANTVTAVEAGTKRPTFEDIKSQEEPLDQSDQFGTSGQPSDEQASEVKGAFEKTPANRRREAQILGGAAGLVGGGAKYLTISAPYQIFMAAKNFLGRNPVSLEEATKVLNAAYGSQTENAVLDATQTVSGKPTGVDAYIPSQTRSKANAEQLAAVANVPPPETNAEAQQAIKRISAEAHPSDRIPVKRTVMRNGVPYQETIRYRPPAPSKGPELQQAVRPDEFIISDPYPSNVPPITQASLRGHNLGPTPYVAFQGQQSPIGIWEDSNPRDTGALKSALQNARQSTVNAAKNLGTTVASAAPVIGRGVTSVLGSVPFRIGAAGASALGNYSDYQSAKEKGDTTGQAVAATGGLGALASLVPKISPYGGLVAGGADTARRVREGDYTGAAISGGATLAPFAARAAFGAPLGPAGSVAAMSAPMVYDAIKYKAWQDAQRLAEALKTEEGRKTYWLTRGVFD
jgi:hypothetical protein